MYVMAILGCGDAGGLCTQARVEPARYVSIQACRAAMSTALTRHTDLDYPEISVQCRASRATDPRQIASTR